MFEALQIESDFEGFIEVRSSLVNQLPFLDGPVSPRTLLRIVGGDLNADPIVCRSVNSTVIFVRSDPVLAIPALKHLVIGIALRALILAEAIAQQRFHGNGCGESLRLEGLLGLVMRRHLDGFLCGGDQHF
jgi:hypothetical protein